MLGNIYERAKQVSKNEDDKNHWSDLASKCYDLSLIHISNMPMARASPQANDSDRD